jgi:hypothetical protein
LLDLNLFNVGSKGPMISLYLSKDESILDQKSINERWKDLLSKAEFYLLKDYSRSYTNEFLKKLKNSNSLEKLTPLDRGIIIFYSLEGFDNQIGFVRTQLAIKDLIVVADSYHIKPMIRIRNNFQGFFLVTMTSRSINVLIENKNQLIKLESYRNDPGNNGLNKVDNDLFYLNAFKELNKLFKAYSYPIILAGVKEHITHMSNLLDQSMLMPNSIVCNIEKVNTEELHEKVKAILAPYYLNQEKKAVLEIDDVLNKGKIVTYLEDIAVSAVQGSIKKLFIVENKYIWGSVNKRSGEILISPMQINTHDDDVLDDICQIVLSKGGEVAVVKDLSQLNGHFAVAIISERINLPA